MPDGGLVMENERKNRLAETTARARRQPLATRTIGPSLLQKETADEDEAQQEETETAPTEQADFGQTELQQQMIGEFLGRQQQQSRLAQMKSQLLEESGLAEKKKEAAEKIRKQVKVSIRRGFEELFQGTGNTVDAATGGVSLIVTIFGYALTLTDLNLQMFWGYYITKKKSFFFPALEWDPIPMPKIVSVRILHAGLVVLDILVVIGIVVALSIQIIIMTAPFAAIATPLLYATSPEFRSVVNNFILK